MTLSPACGGSSPEGGASYFSLSLRERWHAVGVTERVFRGEHTSRKPKFEHHSRRKRAPKTKHEKKKEIFTNPLQNGKRCGIILLLHRGIAQLVESLSPKQLVVGSSPFGRLFLTVYLEKTVQSIVRSFRLNEIAKMDL